ncbi:uncharacterized protein MELLADRAFT_68116 [Melampsora larici-populina 98AG31]|uniref:Secreted protein n=1 Tax=Melampsora larici-populina (strain 98AG31 / pathotype 3-4-7) TaxID=747676 RepID=F4S5M5_MELLP|nr:uncharacterized protein MELLADRAFT_68116 [Melampsora larici-populina 98AG31]EGG00052.1 hypothetical protein MELLADRAFT_68116 [Melampsora larici-populina 98AG31]
MMLNQGKLSIVFLLLKGFCDAFAAGENEGEALQSMSGRILNFDLNAPPPPDIDETKIETNAMKDPIHNRHDKSVSLNAGLEHITAQNSSPIPRPSVRTSDFKMCDQRSNQPQAGMEEKKSGGPDISNSCRIPAREAKTRLLTELYESEEVWGKSVPGSKRMRICSEGLSSEMFEISSSDNLKTSQPGTSPGRSAKSTTEMHSPQGVTELQDSISNHIPSRVRESNRKYPQIFVSEDLDKDALPPKELKQELPHKLLALTASTSSPASLERPSIFEIKTRMGLQEELTEPDWDCSETQDTGALYTS